MPITMKDLHKPLLSAENRVESPFIIVKIGNYTFGSCSSQQVRDNITRRYNITYPNYMESLHITKINGQVNLYTLNIVYGITQFDDPNKLDKVFSSVADTRKITLTYGDWNQPGYIYREEEALITKLTTNVNFGSSQIRYTLNCTSSAMLLNSGSFGFPALRAKPSDIIKNVLLGNQAYGLSTVFSGMSSRSLVEASNLIASNDKVVDIPAKESITPLDYLNYLVSYMTPESDTGNNTIGSSVYQLVISDDVKNEFGGPYFKVVEVKKSAASSDSYATYSVDVGYPGDNYVTEFSIRNDDSWAILYKYSQDVNMSEYQYRIDDSGKMVSEFSPTLTQSNKYLTSTQASSNWWTLMTEFPIQATLTIKGLIRPALLIQYVRINAFFYGHKHTSSGLYIVIKQQDDISASGYRTTLNLLRIGGDE